MSGVYTYRYHLNHISIYRLQYKFNCDIILSKTIITAFPGPWVLKILKMISDKSLQPLIWCVRAGQCLNMLPYYWQDGRLGLLKDNGLQKFLCTIHVLAHFGCSAYIVYRVFTIQPKLSPTEIIMIIFLLGVVSLALTPTYLTIYRCTDFQNFFNTLLRVNEVSTG